MVSLNKVELIGRLGHDPELTTMQNGQVCNLSLATDESYKNQKGEKVERTEWHRIVTYNKQAEFCANYLERGNLVFIEGRLRTRKWQDRNGNDRYITVIIANRIQPLEWKKQDSASSSVPEPEPPEGMDEAPF